MWKVSFMLIGFLLFTACGSKKGTTSTGLSFQKQRLFDEAYFAGATQKVQGNYPSAISHFQKALELQPQSHEVLYQLANIYFKNKQLNEAIHFAEQAVAKHPGFNFWYSGQLAQFYNRSGQYQNAANVFEQMIRAEPDRESNYEEIANQYLNLQKPQTALDWLNAHEKQFGYKESIIRKKESIYLRLGEFDLAAKEIKKLLVVEPENTRYLGLLAEIYTKADRPDEAEKYYQQILLVDSSNGYACFGLADVLRKKGQDDLSFDYLKLGFGDDRVPLQTKLKVISSYYFLLQRDEKSRKQAFELGEVILATHPNDALSTLMYGDLLLANEQVEEARKYYRESLEIDPSDYRIWKKLFSMSQQLQNPSYLEKDVKNALEFFPSQAELYILLAYAHMEQGSFKDAIKVAEEGQLYALESDHKKEILIVLAECYNETKSFEKSGSIYDKLIETYADDPLVLNNYAYFLAQQKKQLEKALNYSRKSLEMEPGNASYMDTYGWILFQMEQYAEAETWVKKALESAAFQSAVVLEHYGDILFKLDRIEEAVNYWRLAIKAGGAKPQLEQKINLKQL